MFLLCLQLAHIQPSEDEDVTEQMQKAKQKTRQRFQDETVKSGTEAEDTAASELGSLPTLSDSRPTRQESADTVDGETPRPTSARTPRGSEYT